jgi:26S proteasome non-ATPase regulatory subunit 10
MRMPRGRHAHTKLTRAHLTSRQQNDPKLSKRKDDDGRYPIHWAASSNNLDIVLLLANQKGFDPDVQVRNTA